MLILIEIKCVTVTEAAGKMQSVEELEARMRQQGLNVAQQNKKNITQSSSNKKTDEDLAAFRKLVRSFRTKSIFGGGAISFPFLEHDI
jgi:hypothetical protein